MTKPSGKDKNVFQSIAAQIPRPITTPVTPTKSPESSKLTLQSDSQKRPFPMGLEVDHQRISPRRIEAIYKAINEGPFPLYWHGPTGRGKTFCAALVYADWQQDFACFWPASKIANDIVDGQLNQTLSPIRNTVRDATLIVVDDIVDRNMTDARCAALCDLINWRAGKPMILTGNFSPKELPKAVPSDRLVSRILSGRAQGFEGPDMRIANLHEESI